MIKIGKIKVGPRYRDFLWGHNNFSKDDLPSTTIIIISKDYVKREKVIQSISGDNLTVVNLNTKDTSEIIEELKKTKTLIRNRGSSNKDEYNNQLICLNDYDLLLYNDNTTEINQIKTLINYINDYGKRVGVFLILGCNSLNEKFIDSIDNIILLPPYNISNLTYLFINSTYSIINQDDPIGQFCKTNGIDINQMTKEPQILKNGNNIYLYKCPNEK